VRLTAELQPAVVVMDTDMPVMDGIEATRLITGAAKAPAVLVLTTGGEVAALDALLAGARGLLLRTSDGEQIAGGIRLAAAGQSALSPAIAGMLV
jgi:DNA-binding NarL/FixJ family response regulator